LFPRAERKVYLNPLRKAIEDGKPVISERKMALIFLNINDVLQVNKVLLASMEERLKQWSTQQLIADIFSNLVESLTQCIAEQFASADLISYFRRCPF
jgi:hypothetical protein